MEEQDYIETREQVRAIADAIVGRCQREMDLRVDLCKAELEKKMIEANIEHHEDCIRLIEHIQESNDMIMGTRRLAVYAAAVSTVVVILLFILMFAR